MTSYVNPETRHGGVRQIVVQERRQQSVDAGPPKDGRVYVMQDGIWVPAPDDGGRYAIQDGAWVRVPKTAVGYVLVTVTADVVSTASVTFPAGLFDTPPRVFTNALTSVPGTRVIETSASNITTSGCDVYIYRSSSTDTGIMWFAVEEI